LMKNVLITAVVTAALACGTALAQSTPAPDPATPQAQPSTPNASPQTRQAPAQTSPSAQPAQAASRPKIAPGSVIPVQLTKSVDAKKAKTGDEVVAKVKVDMKNQSGEVLVPKDTKVIGHVTEAQARSKEQKESQLAIAFDRAVMKDGGDLQMPMSIQAIIGQQNNNVNPGGNEAGAPPPSGGGIPSSGGGGRSPMGGSSSTPPPSPSATSGAPAETEAGNAGARPPINAQTTGVIGISNMTLAAGQNATQGSVMSSDKNNVKLDSGTMLLLKVIQ
jgi:hypothetical protein